MKISAVNMAILVSLLVFCGTAKTSSDHVALTPPQYTVTDLGSWSDTSSETSDAYAINDTGQVVGTSDGHAFLWTAGQLTDLGVLPDSGPCDGGAQSRAYALNNHAQVVGSSGGYCVIFMTGLVQSSAFVWSKGHMTSLVGNVGCEALGINNQGAIVGTTGYRGFLDSGGRRITIPSLSARPSGNGTRATAINDRNQIVGATTMTDSTPELPVRAFLWESTARDHKMRNLGTLPGLPDSIATDVNVQSEVVGYAGEKAASKEVIVYGRIEDTAPSRRVKGTESGTVLPAETGSRTRAFFWKGGRMGDLGTLPGADDSQAFGVNDSGLIVGQSGGHAVLWRSGRIIDLNQALGSDADWVLTVAHGINARGQIVGTGWHKGQHRAFLLTPSH